MVKKGKTADDVSSARTRTADRGSVDTTMSSMSRAESWGEEKRSSPIRKSQPAPRPAAPLDLQAQSRVREKQREEIIVKKHLFGVPPPDDKSLFEDPAVCFEW